MTIKNFSYLAGKRAALVKLGTVPGPIPYKTRKEKDPFNYASNQQQDLWAEFDREPRTTGEESSLGSFAKSGVDGHGSIDQNRLKPNHPQLLRNEIDLAFKSNENLDQSFAPEPPAKFANAFAGIKQMGASALKPQAPGSKLPGMQSLFKPPKLNNLGTRTPSQLAPMPGIQSATNASDVAKTFNSPQARLMGGPL